MCIAYLMEANPFHIQKNKKEVPLVLPHTPRSRTLYAIKKFNITSERTQHCPLTTGLFNTTGHPESKIPVEYHELKASMKYKGTKST